MSIAAPLASPPRGFRPVFRVGEQVRCPACGGSNWHVGRESAECGFCATALPLAEGSLAGTKVQRG